MSGFGFEVKDDSRSLSLSPLSILLGARKQEKLPSLVPASAMLLY
jgi:hypothetical protein